MAPAFDELVNVAPEKPVKLTVWAMPGIANIFLTALLMTASVRLKEAPGGN